MTDLDILGERSSAVPRGPQEWGNLIYQEPWAYKRRTPGRYDLLLIVIILAFGSVLLAAGLAFALTQSWVLTAIYGGIGLYLYAGSANMVLKLRHTLPFRVYTRGLTLPEPQPSRRYEEERHFFPFSRVMSAEVKQDDWAEGPSSFIRFIIETELGEERERIVSPKRGVEVGPIVEALKRAHRDLPIEKVGDVAA